MNFEKVSFRTRKEEQTFLEDLNKRFKCKSLTELMHKLLQFCMKGDFSQIASPNVFGDIDFTPKVSEKQEKSAQKASFVPKVGVPIVTPAQNARYDPLVDFLKTVEEMERAGRIIQRSLTLKT